MRYAQQHLTQLCLLLAIHIVHGTPQHILNELFPGDILRFHRGNVFPVAEDGSPVADLHYLVQLMRNVDDRNALPLQLHHQLQQNIRLPVRQGRGRLIHNDDPGISGQRPADLQHLLLGNRQARCLHMGIHVQMNPA